MGETPKSSEAQWKDEDFLSLELRKNGTDANDDDASDSDSEKQFPPDTDTGGNDHGLPPWMSHPNEHVRRQSPMLALHNELVDFCRLVEPTEQEIKERDALVSRVRDLAISIFPKATVRIFGSQATGLLLPSSDIDLMILTNESSEEKEKNQSGVKDGAEQEQEWDKLQSTFGMSPLRRFETAIRDKWLPELSYLEAVENTKIPLVKFTLAATNISCDVCFDQDMTAPKSAQLMKKWLHRLPPLRPLTMFLKYFLVVRGLNEPYSGGVGSYLLQLMIVSFLQHRERLAYNHGRASSLPNLGCLLLDFLELYGVGFNYLTTGISVRNDGKYFPKGAPHRKSVFWDPTRTFMLAVENPLDPSQDVGKSSFRVRQVQGAFAAAYKVLLTFTTEPMEPCHSILASVLTVAPELKARAQVLRKQKRKSGSPKVDPRKRKRSRQN